MRDRKNQRALTSNEWAQLVDAINQTHGVGASAPAYRDFVAVHARAMNPLDADAMTWGVHTMGSMMQGTNFLAWHRWFVLQMENRLRQVHSDIVLPYWDAITDREIPAALKVPALLKSWGIERNWKPAQLAHTSDVTAALQMGTFPSFQRTLEGAVHASVHNAVGGQMATGSSPADPLFWLHHANLDRLWDQWRSDPAHASDDPPNQSDQLQPPPIFGAAVSKVNTTSGLGYRYV